MIAAAKELLRLRSRRTVVASPGDTVFVSPKKIRHQETVYPFLGVVKSIEDDSAVIESVTSPSSHSGAPGRQDITVPASWIRGGRKHWSKYLSALTSLLERHQEAARMIENAHAGMKGQWLFSAPVPHDPAAVVRTPALALDARYTVVSMPLDLAHGFVGLVGERTQ